MQERPDGSVGVGQSIIQALVGLVALPIVVAWISQGDSRLIALALVIGAALALGGFASWQRLKRRSPAAAEGVSTALAVLAVSGMVAYFESGQKRAEARIESVQLRADALAADSNAVLRLRDSLALALRSTHTLTDAEVAAADRARAARHLPSICARYLYSYAAADSYAVMGYKVNPTSAQRIARIADLDTSCLNQLHRHRLQPYFVSWEMLMDTSSAFKTADGDLTPFLIRALQARRRTLEEWLRDTRSYGFVIGVNRMAP